MEDESPRQLQLGDATQEQREKVVGGGDEREVARAVRHARKARGYRQEQHEVERAATACPDARQVHGGGGHGIHEHAPTATLSTPRLCSRRWSGSPAGSSYYGRLGRVWECVLLCS